MRNKLFDEIMGRFYEAMDDVLESLHGHNDIGRFIGAMHDLRLCGQLAKAYARQQLSGCTLDFAVEQIDEHVAAYTDIIFAENMQEQLDLTFG